MRRAPPAIMGVAAALAATLACGVAGCDEAAGTTRIELTVRFDESITVDQLRLTVLSGGRQALAPVLVPEEPRTLSAGGERAAVLLPDSLAGVPLVLRVDGLEAGAVVASGGSGVVVPAGEAAELEVTLAAPAVCGDGVVRAPIEPCDDGNGDDGDGCDGGCLVEVGFACTGAPSVCEPANPACGNGSVDVGETCDDGNAQSDDGCSIACVLEPGFVCDEPGAPCAPVCGDGLLRGGEGCDDGDLVADDGCDDACAVEPGFACAGEPSECTLSCGNGALDPGEACDDGDRAAGDGCDGLCALEAGFVCSGAPSECSFTCFNGELDPNEECDDGNLDGADGCSANCAVEAGFTCDVVAAPCAPICGDGLVRGGEPCDDGALAPGDGCDVLCVVEPNFLCSGEPSLCVPTCTIDGVEVAEGTLDPADPCRGCQPGVDTAAFTTLPDGTTCADDAFCNGAEVCSAGVCGAPPEGPCPASEPECDEDNDDCSCAIDATCDDGLFCTGEERCNPGQRVCTPGTPPPCEEPAPACSDELARCVGCLSDADCGAPVGNAENPFCVDNVCTACADCACPFGEIESAEGCVPLPPCPDGELHPVVDLDGDGVGAGQALEECVDLPAEGLTDENTDCDDTDATRFTVRALFPDVDGDGFTAALSNVCAGLVAPPGFRFTRAPPPFVSFASRVQADSNPAVQAGRWSNVDGPRERGGREAFTEPNAVPSHALLLSDFALRLPDDAVIRGVQVNVRRRTRAGTNATGFTTDVGVNLFAGGAISANRARPEEWLVDTFEEVAYGGPTDLWGLSLTPAIVNAPDFGFSLVIDGASEGNGGNRMDAEVDHVWIEVFTDQGDDCDDNDDTLRSARTALPDRDGDNFGGPAETTCTGAELPSPFSEILELVEPDCFDGNADARPNQTAFFVGERGDGSFDFNCDGLDEKNGVSTVDGCSCAADLVNCAIGNVSTFLPNEACGQQEPTSTCSAGCGCGLVGTSETVQCR